MPILNNLTVNEIGGSPSLNLTCALYGDQTEIDSLLGFEDGTTVLQSGQAFKQFAFPNLVEVSGEEEGYGVFSDLFYGSAIEKVYLGNLQTVSGNNAFSGTFMECGSLDYYDIHNLTTVSGDFGCAGMFQGCLLITSANVPALTTVSGNLGCSGMFQDCASVVTADVGNLTTVTEAGCDAMFAGTAITELRLPSLVSVGQMGLASLCANCLDLEEAYFDSLDPSQCGYAIFGDDSINYAFEGCDALVEIHFPQGTQSEIEQWEGFADKWGATNATIYFDL